MTLTALVVCLVTSSACSRREPAELPLSTQVAEVDKGTRETILIENVALGDDDLTSLTYVKGLRDLLLDHPDSVFSAAGFSELMMLPNLRHLRIRGRGIDDAALTQIAKIKSLQILNVPQADITDAGIAVLADLPHLEQLRIASPHLSSAGLEAIAALPALKRLHTIDVPIDDEGLRTLAGMKALQSLYIDGGSFSDAAAEELFRTRPDLHVHFNQQHHDGDPHAHTHP